MSLKNFFNVYEVAQWLEGKSGEPMLADDVHRLVRQGALPVCLPYRGYVAAFPIEQDPLKECLAPMSNLRRFYFSGYLRIRRHAEYDVPIGATGKNIDVMLIARAEVAAPDASFSDIELPSNTALWPTNEDGDLRHQIVRSGCWLFHVEDLPQLLAVGAEVARAPIEGRACEGPAKADDGKEWTPGRLAELKTYREQHGTKAAAEKYGISTARIRTLLPSGKPRPQGYSAFTHRQT